MHLRNCKCFWTGLMMAVAMLERCFITCSFPMDGNNIIAFLNSFYRHFDELPVHFVYESSTNPDSYQSVLLHMSKTQLGMSNPPLLHFMGPTEMAAPDYQIWKVQDENVIVLVSIDSETAKNELESLANSGFMEKGIWAVPHGLISQDFVLSRYDSNIYVYTVDRVGSFVSLQEFFSIKKRHRFANEWGNWSLESGLTLHIPHMWERRTKFLQGVQLRGVYLEWTPFTFVSKNGSTYGIIPDFIKIFQV